MSSIFDQTAVLAAAAALAASALGCIDTDAAVFVDASIASPSAVVSAGALGTNLSAIFQLELHLGPRASGPSQVNVRAIEITNADQSASIVAPLEAVPDRTLPVEVAPDSDVVVVFSFDTATDGAPLAPEAYDALCAGEIRIAASVEDSLQDGATPAASAPFQATCM